jgi:hypothetical protein
LNRAGPHAFEQSIGKFGGENRDISPVSGKGQSFTAAHPTAADDETLEARYVDAKGQISSPGGRPGLSIAHHDLLRFIDRPD